MVNNIPGGVNSPQNQQSNSTQSTQQIQIALNNNVGQPKSQDPTSTEKKNEGVASVEDIRNAVEELNNRLETEQIQVNFDVDDETGRIVVKVKDTNSGEVIRQIPSEATLEFARNAQKGIGITLDGTF